MYSQKDREKTPDNSDSDDGSSEKTDSKPLSASSVKLFLKEHPGFLEKYIMEEVDLEQLERWMIRRTQRSRKTTQSLTRNNRKTSLSTWKFCVHADKRQMLLDLTHSLQLSPPKDHVLIELANCISSAVNAHGFTLYIAEPCCPPDSLSIYCGQTAKYQKAKQPDDSIALYVAKTKESIRLSRELMDPRFPNGICKKDDIEHILCQAITQPDGQLVAVLELHRSEEGFPFHEEDEEISSSYLVWGGIALHYAHLFVNMSKQRKLNEFLLALVKSIFQDMVSMETLITKIIKFAQRLVDADRASLFLVDSKSQELYATIFDVGNEESDTKLGAGSDDDSNKTKDEIRFPIGTGIAGIVALNGENLNIHDVYADPRFNRSVDQKTGYKTENILCMPISNRGSIIGVVQMINKRTGHFVKEDEEAFEMFAIYCGLALHHSKLYNQIRRSQQKFKVALEVLSYHNSSTDEEVQQILADKTSDIVPHLDEFYFDPFAYEDLKKVKFATHMFVDLFGLKRFDRTNLIRFALTVKKNYRRVPYHNWNHGFSVANTIYTIIKQTGNLFRPIEGLALYIASLCHDLDHRGKNNKFMLEMGSPLAAIYSTSTMEHHHFNQTVTILQQEGHNIFAKLSNVEYKLVLSLIKHCILATDLEQFFPCKAKLTALIDDEKFTWSSQEHRLMIQAITMTAGDLSASAKPWDIQEKTVKVIFQEFYDQGDAERAAGLIPIPMMDREKPEEQANSQVSFLTGICIPCYSLLYRFIPETKPLLDRCQENLSLWQERANKTYK